MDKRSSGYKVLQAMAARTIASSPPPRPPPVPSMSAHPSTNVHIGSDFLVDLKIDFPIDTKKQVVYAISETEAVLTAKRAELRLFATQHAIENIENENVWQRIIADEKAMEHCYRLNKRAIWKRMNESAAVRQSAKLDRLKKETSTVKCRLFNLQTIRDEEFMWDANEEVMRSQTNKRAREAMLEYEKDGLDDIDKVQLEAAKAAKLGAAATPATKRPRLREREKEKAKE